ncbi:MAG: IMP dehydrogenase [Oleiphilus sp.]|nr:MAG: IMP dehydrogenase [Oleiphilus sp.]
MAIRVVIRHSTHYQFDREVALSPHTVRLRPAPHCRTPIESYSLQVAPKEHFINWQLDPFSNYMTRLVFPEKARELKIDVEVIARLDVINPFDFFIEDYAQSYPFEYESELGDNLKPYLKKETPGPLLAKWLEDFEAPKEVNSAQFLYHVNQLLAKQIKYNIRMEPGVQSCESTLTSQTGSCRDTAWLLVQICRHLGLAARFVSGYLVQLKSDEKSLDGPSGPEEDFTDLHAWAEVYIPGAGWIGLDPTSGLFAGEGHIPLAATPEPQSAAPISGALEDCKVEFSFSNTVERLAEEPRITKPFSDELWSHALALGKAVQKELDGKGVELTMGGEPTFVSIDDMEAAQWNTTADGEHKRKLAHALFERMSTHYAQAPLHHYGQGKWYPGEPLPRWQYGCYWRADGKPIWHSESTRGVPGLNEGVTLDQARQFSEAVVELLGVPGDCLLPAYEDVYYLMWQEANLPPGDKPEDLTLSSSDKRRVLFSALENEGFEKPRGFVLPLAWDLKIKRWHSCHWQFKRKHCYLTPGDSPIGLRLPLDSISWTPLDKREYPAPKSLFDDFDALAEDFERYKDVHSHEVFIQSALCLEVRNGGLYVFMPPVSSLDEYLDIIARLQASAELLKLKIVIEGYTPPKDPRLVHFMVTPDPGVIEVNVHPVKDWDSLVDNTQTLYQLAQKSRLGTAKFMLDGTQTGTGGGNHVTLGGITPDRSPLLRRPALLQSLITFWQHHPGLSYLFSGQFIGPTSQAPRVDEARDEILYELELAFSQIPEGDVDQPWLADRLLRNLLVDLTGNTHRAEFCIDKLYSPDSPTGRLGILEFRGFEMPPHARMSLVQMLLLRTLVARFWDQPYRHPLVHWGAKLHDHYLLPHFVWEDVKDVCGQLQDWGYPFLLEWLRPFLEFRFPVYGRHQILGMQIELRQAIEPWHVLGEEVSQSGTSRYVDSSLERLQIKISGLVEERYVVCCNRRKVVLTPTGIPGEYVAGVKYRAWQPPSALHPMLKVNSPLVFDIVDTWSGKAVGGCTYHVTHPGGRSYETFPVNSNEAEGRRINRFFDIGHSIGELRAPEPLKPRVESAGIFYPEGSPPGIFEPIAEPPGYRYGATLDLRTSGANTVR